MRHLTCVSAVLALALLALAPLPGARAQAPQPPEYNGTFTLRSLVPFQGIDGHEHYIQLRQDTAGVVRVLVSLHDTPAGSYHLDVHPTANCDASAGSLLESHDFIYDGPVAPEGPDLYYYFDTVAFALADDSPNTLYDDDGTALSIELPSGERLGCAVLSSRSPELFFNHTIVLEYAVAFRGSDSREHYVTPREDTQGIVQVILQLTDVPAGTYAAVTYGIGDCAGIAGFGAADVLDRHEILRTSYPAGATVYHYYVTDSFRLTRSAPNTLYDADGTSLAVYYPDGSLLGCADLSSKEAQPLPTVTPEAPVAGAGTVRAHDSQFAWIVAGLALGIAGSGTFALAARRR